MRKSTAAQHRVSTRAVKHEPEAVKREPVNDDKDEDDDPVDNGDGDDGPVASDSSDADEDEDGDGRQAVVPPMDLPVLPRHPFDPVYERWGLITPYGNATLWATWIARLVTLGLYGCLYTMHVVIGAGDGVGGGGDDDERQTRMKHVHLITALATCWLGIGIELWVWLFGRTPRFLGWQTVATAMLAIGFGAYGIACFFVWRAGAVHDDPPYGLQSTGFFSLMMAVMGLVPLSITLFAYHQKRRFGGRLRSMQARVRNIRRQQRPHAD